MPTTQTATARIEVFRPGTFTPMQGQALTYSAADLRAIADSYDPAVAPAPIVVGHPSTDAPAFGWARAFDYDQDTGRLHATVGDIDPAFSEAVKAGRYKKVSLSFFRPDQGNNPVPGTWYPKHIGFLGGAAPAVSGLRNVQFAQDAGVTIVTGTAAFAEDTGAEMTAGLFRALREFFIEKFGRDETDKVLPDYRIEWLDRAGRPAIAPAFADPVVVPAAPIIPEGAVPASAPPSPDPIKEAAVPQSTPVADPAHAEREAALAIREAALAERETADRHADNASFAESLVSQGKLLPASKDAVTAILDGLPADGGASVSFAEGEAALSPAQALRRVLDAQPKVVTFGKTEVPGADKGAVSFASGGEPVDAAGLQTYQKAKAHQAANPGCDWLAAVAAVS